MISRRYFISALGAASSMLLPRAGWSQAATPAGEGWRRFEVVTRIELAAGRGRADAWIPLAAFAAGDWIRPQGNVWSIGDGAKADVGAGGALLHVSWDEGAARSATVTSLVTTRDRKLDPNAPEPLDAVSRARYLGGTTEAPLGGLIRETATRITRGAQSDAEKAKALYDWVVLNTFRDPATPGCGEGQVAAMLQSGRLGGKCADINPLFVALARASGLPARDLYGIRVAPSRLGYKSLGPSTPLVTKAQHCRAEVYLDGLGWTAMDPADVRKVMLEEAPGGLPLTDPKVAAARDRLFGSWEGNWIAFNDLNDVALPGCAQTAAFLMYPQFATAEGPLDCYRPEQVRYSIEMRELPV